MSDSVPTIRVVGKRGLAAHGVGVEQLVVSRVGKPEVGVGQDVGGRLSLGIASLSGGEETPWPKGPESSGISDIAGYSRQLRASDGLVAQLPVRLQSPELNSREVGVFGRTGQRVELRHGNGIT